MIKIAHIITDLDIGGAEIMLHKLLSRLDQQRFMNMVISLKPMGPLGAKILSLGVPVFDLGMRRGIITPMGFLRLAKLVLSWKPTIIQTWLYHADLIGFLVAKVVGTGKVVWNIRCSNMDLRHYPRLTSWTVKLCSMFSPFPETVITNSYSAKKYHKELGYNPKKFVVIPNGFDVDIFSPATEARDRLRSELRVEKDSKLVGLVARFDPMKDHRTFLLAAGRIVARAPHVHFVLAGDRIEYKNKELSLLIDELELKSHVHLLGQRDNISAIVSALDIACSSSYGEGFSNAIGEAMACSVPCVVTDVGDSARIVGETGKVVPPQDPNAFAESILELLRLSSEERRGLGRLARERISKHYSIDKIAIDYERLYWDIAGR